MGNPIGHPEYVRRFLLTLSDKHQTSLSRIPLVGDVQAAMAPAGTLCGGEGDIIHRGVSTQRQWKGSPGGTTRACWSASVPYCTWIGAQKRGTSSGCQCLWEVWVPAVPFALAKAVHWACRADCLPMILWRHPDVARLLLGQLDHPTTTSACRLSLGLRGNSPEWAGLSPHPGPELATSMRRLLSTEEHLQTGGNMRLASPGWMTPVRRC